MTTQFAPGTVETEEDAQVLRALLESQAMELTCRHDRYMRLEADFQEMSAYAMSCEDKINKLTGELARVASRHVELERDLNQATASKDQYFTMAQEERRRAEELKAWQMSHSSCQDTTERLPEKASRAVALEARNHELEWAFDRLKNENDDLRGNMMELYQMHSLCEDAITEQVSRAAALELRNHELEEELESMTNRLQTWKVDAQWQNSKPSAYDPELPVQEPKLFSSSAAHTEELQRTHSESSTTNLSEASTSSQPFVTSGDVGTVSATNAIRLIEALNSDISLGAVRLPGSFPDDESDDETDDLDLETTQLATLSGVSYSIMDPGVVPVINGVNRYPSEERTGSDAKIPSIIYYDSKGSVHAVGAEALRESNAELAGEHRWFNVQRFKLHLHPLLPRDEQPPPLPPNKTIVEVLGDFLQYLFSCTRSYIEETHASVIGIWESLQDDPEFVLTHPNDWKSTQKDQMLRATIYGGLVPDTPEGRTRIHFLKEGEASLHHCIRRNCASDTLKSGDGVIVLDAGGATVSLSTYCVKETRSWYEEIIPPTYHFRGSAFVTRCAHGYLERRLSNSCYDTPNDVVLFTECFDKTTKLAFNNPNDTSFIKFGAARENEPSIDVKYGQLRLQGSDVAAFFEPSISTLQQAIQEHLDCTPVPITTVLMVGGFAASDWLFSNLQNHLDKKGIRLARPDGQLGKAVANGAVSFFVDQFVTVPIKRSIRRGVKLIPQESITEEDASFLIAIALGNIKTWAGDAVARLLELAHNVKRGYERSWLGSDRAEAGTLRQVN